MELSYSQLSHLLKRFPEFELSYENILHNKVSNKYNVCLAIPIGKKYFAWFTFHENKDICYLFELNKDKKIIKCKIVDVDFNYKLSLGTIVYGTLWEDTNNTNCFVIEDIMYFEGIYMKSYNFQEKLDFLYKFMCKIREYKQKKNLIFGLPVFLPINNDLLGDIKEEDIKNSKPNNICDISSINYDNIAYPVHHIQYRSLNEIMPYLNVNINRKINTQNISKPLANRIELGIDYSSKMDLSKSQYKYKTVFQVSADIQYDIYYLFAFGKNNKPVNFGLAYIPTYKKSIFMNSLFRKIRENKNLDYIEESDNEEDFEDINENKYVDLKKIVLMECSFHIKFKKWIPLRVVERNSKIVHISKLIF